MPTDARTVSSERTLADVTFGHLRLALGRRAGAPVEEHRDLVAGAELRIGATLLVDHPEDVPFVVRPAAYRGRRAQAVVLAERRLAQAAGGHRLVEVGIGFLALVEECIELA